MTRPEAADWRAAIEPARTAFFLDVDGTLLDFRDRPEDVVADEELLRLIGRLQVQSSNAVALVSGRMVVDLDRIMAPLVLPAGGVHGADIRFADGRRQTLGGNELADVREATKAFVEANEGLRFEDKGGTTFALHYRGAPERAADVTSFLEGMVEGRDVMVQHGKMVAEVKPNACHKGIAIEALMETAPFAGRVPLFIGDDLTDEHGFARANRLGGISIKVGDGETIAHHRLANTDEVRAFFVDLLCRSDEGTQKNNGSSK